jgi:hypothetical protein
MRGSSRTIIVPGGSGGAGAPTDADYIVAAANGSLSAEVAPSAANQVPVSSSSTAAAWGTVPIAAGGSGQVTATAAFDALAPTTTQGDLIYHNGTDNVRLAKGTAGQFLRVNAGATAPEWGYAPVWLSLAAGDAGGLNPAANTAYFFSFDGLDPNTVTNIGGIWVPCNGTINRVWIRQYVAGTNGTNGQNITYVLHKNGTTDSGTFATLDTDVDVTDGSTSSLNFAVSQGDNLTVKFTTPNPWTTPATAMFFRVSMLLEATV